MDPVINANLKNDKQSPMSKPIHSEKMPPPVDFAIDKQSAKTYVNCGLLSKESSSLLQLAVSNSIQAALNSSLETEILSGDNFIYCNFCCSLKSPSMVPAFLEIGRYLVIQLKRFVSHDNQVLKDMKNGECAANISVPVKDNEVTFHKHYQLIATISHTGNLNRGHYTAFMKIPNSKS